MMMATGRFFSRDSHKPFFKQRTGTCIAYIDLVVLKRPGINLEMSSR
jgi:hypothetical protein